MRLAKPLIALVLLPLLMGAAAPAQLSFGGYGPVKIGMTRGQVIKALGVDLVADSGDFDGCYEVPPVGGKPNLSFMFEDGRLSRVVAWDASGIRTDKGIHVGSTEAEVRRAYGKALKQEPHPYDDGGGKMHDLYLWRAKTSGMRFDINAKGRVDAIYVGRQSIGYSEGCA